MITNRLIGVFFTLALIGWQQVVNAACEDPGYRQFDFWLGQWQVHTPDGKLAGFNEIRSEYDGCVVHEQYQNERGFRGESLNTYDAHRAIWHQTWVDNTGLLLLLEGTFRGGSMVLEGQVIGEGGQVTRHRITWTPDADGSVRQLWESTDAEGNWITAFDGRYTRSDASG